MSERLKSVKVPLSAWQALTRICAATEEPRTKALARLILEAEKQQEQQERYRERSGERTTPPQE